MRHRFSVAEFRARTQAKDRTKERSVLIGRTRVTALSATAVLSLLAGVAAPTGLAGEAANAQSSATTLQLSFPSAWATSWSYNPYSPNFAGGLGLNFVYLPLSLQRPPNMTNFLPELASGWSTKGNRIIVHIQPKARWQDGSAVTSKDVVDTLLLDGTNGSVWSDITNVTAVNPRTIALTIRPGTPKALVEANVLTQVIYPSSVFGSFVTPSLKKELQAYYAQNATNPTAAGKSPAKSALDAVFGKLSKLNPKQMLGDGPFTLKHMTVDEAQLDRSSTFFDASKVHVRSIIERNTAQPQTIYAQLLSGQADFSNVYLPINIADRFVKTPGAHIALPPSFEQQLVINDHKYPLNMVKVRQALAYVIDRKGMAEAAYGHGKYSDGQWAQQVDGLTPSVARVWLTKKQLASLNPYHLNPQKAAQLLKSVGFTKSGKTWLMPNGKPFTLSLMMYSSANDGISSYQIAASNLTNFGIKSSVDSVPAAQVVADLDQGNFDMSIALVYNLDPLLEFSGALGGNINFIKLGSYSGDRGIGFGPQVNVPGLNTVNVPATIDQEAASTGPGAKMKQLTWDWARLVNQQVPMLTYDNKVYQFSYSTQHFTDWPKSQSPLWALTSLNLTGGLLRMFQQGFVRPK